MLRIEIRFVSILNIDMFL